MYVFHKNKNKFVVTFTEKVEFSTVRNAVENRLIGFRGKKRIVCFAVSSYATGEFYSVLVGLYG